LIICVCR